MSQRLLTLAIGLGLLAPAMAADKPNILFILADDLGWMDLRCQGNEFLETPHLDRLATEGMRFTDAYAPAPVCSPTRAAIMTGHSPARLHITNHLPHQDRFTPEESKLLPAEMRTHLPLEATTIAERLRDDAGYATGFIGKWHLYIKEESQFSPLAQGFDINIAGNSRGGPPTFFDPYGLEFLEDRKKGEYLPDRLADETISFMRKQHAAKKPFYAALFLYTPHWPMEAPEKYVAKYAERPMKGYNHKVYPAMLETMDLALGRVFAELESLGIEEETFVVFTSDNGPYGGVGDARPLRADKGHLYEGGIRVPLIVRWPGKVKAGVESKEPVTLTDFYPTLLSLAGLEQGKDHPGDGADILPLLKGEGKPDREALFWHFPNFAFHKDNRLGSAIRMGDYKLIEFFDKNEVELYNLREDIGEKKDLAEDDPERAEKMRKLLHQWRKDSGAKMPRPRE